jgi:hypothetical protein
VRRPTCQNGIPCGEWVLVRWQYTPILLGREAFHTESLICHCQILHPVRYEIEDVCGASIVVISTVYTSRVLWAR